MSTTRPTDELHPLQLTLGRNLKIARLKLDMNQRTLADLLQTGQTNVSNYETGRVWPQPERLAQLAAALHTTPAALLEEQA